MKKNICYILLRKMSQITYFSWVNLKMLIWNNWQIARMTMTMTYQDGVRIVGGPILVHTYQWKAQIGNIQSFWELYFKHLIFPPILATHRSTIQRAKCGSKKPHLCLHSSKNSRLCLSISRKNFILGSNCVIL